MPVARLSISVTPELSRVLRSLAATQSVDTSRLIETLLRESPMVRGAVAQARQEAAVTTKRGRDVRTLLALARIGRRQWQERLKSGQVKFLGQPD